MENNNNKSMLIPKSINDLYLLFKQYDKKLYLVGGSVRDFLNNTKPKDYDLATDALPNEVIDIIGDKYKTNLQGKSFGVVVVYTDDIPSGIEIATFRSDVYDGRLGKNRNPKVNFTTIDEDVKRRDLTINGLFYDLEKNEIIDLVNGKEDIKNKIIRMIGEPELRIKEDPLRILRTIRFAHRYDFIIDINTKNAIIKNKYLLEIISKERIYDEIKKSFSYNKNNFNNYLNYITEFNMWGDVFPKSNINTKLVDSNNFVIIIANLFKNEPKNNLEYKLIQDYKMEYNLASKVVFLISLLDFNIEYIYDIYKMKIKCDINDKTIIKYMNINNLSKNIFNSFIKYKPTVSSKKLMNIGFSGKELGIKIREMEVVNFKKIMNKNK